MNKTLTELKNIAFSNSELHGFHDNDEVISQTKEGYHALVGQRLALIHSELSEALEADRKDKYCTVDSKYLSDILNQSQDTFKYEFEKYVKDTFEDEIADAVIRILDLCGWLNIDIQKHIEAKMLFNSTREHKHDKEY